jgi:hypothetical protein
MKNFASVALLSAALFAPSAHAQEKPSGTNADNRMTVAFKIPEARLQKLLPAGWESNPPASGANIGITMVEGISSEDAEGKPARPNIGVAVTAPVKKSGTNETGAMVLTGLFMPHYAPGAYGNFMPARISIDRSSRVDAGGKTHVRETWDLKGEDGHSMLIKVAYTRSEVKKNKVEVKVYSGAKPEFYRIYRFEQGTEVVKSASVNHVSSFSFKATGPKLAPIFDGKQQVVAITAVPWYSRAVSLPSP